MNTYKRKRIQHKLSKYAIAREMGFSLDQWDKVENGAVYLDKEYLDKFNDVISRSKEINFNRIAKLNMIKNKIVIGELKKKMQEQGYNFTTLGRKLGKQPSSICNIFALRSCPDDTIEEIYDFLMNPTNKLIDKEFKPTIKKEVIKTEIIEESKDKEETKIIEDPRREEIKIIPEDSKDKEIEKLKSLVAVYKRQLIRYEKLIDRM